MIQMLCPSRTASVFFEPLMHVTIANNLSTAVVRDFEAPEYSQISTRGLIITSCYSFRLFTR
jgi:hypothetical protein